MHDLEDLRERLRHGCDQVAIDLLGQHPNQRLSNASELRFGAKGSFSLKLSWEKRGLWYDFEGGCGGDMFDLIMHHLCCDFAEAIRWAADYFRVFEHGASPAVRARPRMLKPDEVEVRRRDAQRIQNALTVWLRSQPINGTPAETYLLQHRGIRFADGASASVMLPFNVRFDPDEHALVWPVTDDKHALVGVQSVYLDGAGRKRKTEVPKRSRGPIGLGMIRFPGDDHRRAIVLAEGPETGVSIAVATGLEVACAVGNSYKKFNANPRRPIVLAVDDDKRNAQTHHQRRRQVRKWRTDGVPVQEIFPYPERRYLGADFNDLAQSAGLEAVRDRLASVWPRPAPPGDEIGIDEARRRLAAHVNRFFRDAPALMVLHVDLGVGKTTTILKAAHQKLRALRAIGDSRRIVLAVPETRLGDQSAQDFNGLGDGLRARVWRGRSATDPHSPEDLMCRKYDEVEPVYDALGSVPARVCVSCAFAPTCSYEAQKQLTPDLWIVAHAVLFLDHPPEAITGAGLHSLVIDESMWQSGLRGCESDLSIDVAEIERLPRPHLHPLFQNSLVDGRADLAAALRRHPSGYLTAVALRQAGFDASRAKEMAALEDERRLKRDFGSMPLEQLRRRHRKVIEMTLVWSEIERLLGSEEAASGRLEIKSEGDRKILRVSGRKEIHDNFRAPTLLADATYDAELVKWYFTNLPAPVHISVAAPHQRITQATDRAFSKTMLLPTKTDGDVTRRRKKGYRRSLRTVAYEKGLQGPTLLVSNKAVIEWLGPIPGVQTAHFNAVAGRDKWGHVRHLIVIGSPTPTPAQVERMASALTGRPIERLADWYDGQDAQRLVNGLQILAETRSHPDITAKAILNRITSGEVQQALGRPRGVSRTADNPVDVLCLTDVVLPQEVTQAISGYGFLMGRDPILEQLAEHGVAFVFHEDAQRVHRMWPSAEALKKALQRQFGARAALRAHAANRAGHVVAFEYRKAGARTRHLQGFADLRIVRHPKTWVEDRLAIAEWRQAETDLAGISSDREE